MRIQTAYHRYRLSGAAPRTKMPDGHDPGQDHGDPLARLHGRLEGAEDELEEEERDERRRRLVDLQRLDPEAADEAREVEVADRVAPGVLARVTAWESTGGPR